MSNELTVGAFMFYGVEVFGDLVYAGRVADCEDDVTNFVGAQVEVVNGAAIIENEFGLCDF